MRFGKMLSLAVAAAGIAVGAQSTMAHTIETFVTGSAPASGGRTAYNVQIVLTGGNGLQDNVSGFQSGLIIPDIATAGATATFSVRLDCHQATGTSSPRTRSAWLPRWVTSLNVGGVHHCRWKYRWEHVDRRG